MEKEFYAFVYFYLQIYSVVILVVNIGKTFVWYKLQWAVQQARPVAAVGLILQNNKMNTFDALTAKLNTELYYFDKTIPPAKQKQDRVGY